MTKKDKKELINDFVAYIVGDIDYAVNIKKFPAATIDILQSVKEFLRAEATKFLSEAVKDD